MTVGIDVGVVEELLTWALRRELISRAQPTSIGHRWNGRSKSFGLMLVQYWLSMSWTHSSTLSRELLESNGKRRSVGYEECDRMLVVARLLLWLL